MTFKRKKLGNNGENIAVNFLESKNYQIINRNYRNKFGEIDIIARNGDYIVLVEVKTKTIFDQGLPEEHVDYFKQKKLKLLARSLEQIYPENNIRIDVVAVDMSQDKPQINHIINALEM